MKKIRALYVGRSNKEVKKWGDYGCALFGKHYVVTGGEVNLSNNVYLDLIKPHVIFVSGKRGQGKSYTMGTIAEGIQLLPKKIKNNLSCIMMDVMGIYWTMRFPNEEQEELLKEWDLEPTGIDVNVFVPSGLVEKYKEMQIPFDYPFAFIPGELEPQDWCNTFQLELFGKYGVVIERVVSRLKEDKGVDFSIEDITDSIRNDHRTENVVKDALENRFKAAISWGIFDQYGTPISKIAARGKVNIVDTSALAAGIGGFSTKALVIGMTALKVLEARMFTRKIEENAIVQSYQSMFGGEEQKKQVEKMIPMTWFIVDEAHQAIPNPKEGTTPATEPVVRMLREGRQPGLTLVAATQQPGKIHTDLHAQTDLLLTHRVTATADVHSLNAIMGSYMSKNLEDYMRSLPRDLGSMLVLDDANENVYAIKTRPRLSWHGGESACALQRNEEVL